MNVIGRGLDIGTCFINSATMNENEEVDIKTMRDAFFAIENSKLTRKMLNNGKANYLESEGGDQLYICGNEALNYANIFKKEVRRPLHKGVISTREPEALAMIKAIIEMVLGKPTVEKEICKFSVPADPIDADYNIIYHKNVLRSFVEDAGFTPDPINEASAVCYAELAEENFTGLAISFGAGMVNASLNYMGVSSTEFSVSRSGDWIDENAAKAIGDRISRITAIKEKGIDILNPQSREEKTIAIFYEDFIGYVVKCFKQKLIETSELPEFPEPISVVLAGGTSMAKNFDKVFANELKKIRLPFEVKEVRTASDKLFAVAKGCLFASIAEQEEE